MAKRPLPAVPPGDEDSPVINIGFSGLHSRPNSNNSENDDTLFLVQHDFEAGDKNQLSVRKGELIHVLSYDDTGEWCEGQNKNGNIGWLPHAYVVSSESLMRYDWFHGKISRNRAEYLLNSGINGSFLIRESESSPGQHSLSVRYEGRVYHYRVNSDDDNNLFVQEGIKFKTIPELVEHHGQDPGGLVTCLRYAAPKLDKPIVYRISPTADEWEIARTDIVINQKLGGGQYGEVYKAEYKKHNLIVAVKTLKVSNFQN